MQIICHRESGLRDRFNKPHVRGRLVSAESKFAKAPVDPPDLAAWCEDAKVRVRVERKIHCLCGWNDRKACAGREDQTRSHSAQLLRGTS
jgi:hypothetical protein